MTLYWELTMTEGVVCVPNPIRLRVHLTASLLAAAAIDQGYGYVVLPV